MLLVGQDGTGWTPVTGSWGTSASAMYFKNGYVAANSGQMTAAHVSVAATGVAVNCKVYVYSGTRPAGNSSYLAKSDAINVQATGDRSAPISGTIVAGQTYTLVCQPASGAFAPTNNTGAASSTGNHSLVANFPYDNPPNVLPVPDDTAAKELIVWIEGSAGSTVSLVGQAATANAGTLSVPGTGSVLVGQDGTGWAATATTTVGAQSSDAAWFNAGYTAVASGAMTKAHFRFFDTGGTGANIKVCVYQAGTLVGVSSVIPKALGDQSGSISGNIVGGLPYVLVVVADAGRMNGVTLSTGSAWVQNIAKATHFPYASPPTTLPAPDTNSVGHEFAVWIEGTTVVVTAPLTGQAATVARGSVGASLRGAGPFLQANALTYSASTLVQGGTAMNVIAGDLLVIGVSLGDSAVDNVSSVTDNSGANTWTAHPDNPLSIPGQRSTHMFWTVAAANQVGFIATVNLNRAQTLAWGALAQFTQGALSAPLESWDSYAEVAPGRSHGPALVTTRGGPEILVAYNGEFQPFTTETFTPGSGWTLPANASQANPATAFIGMLMYQTGVAAGSYQETYVSGQAVQTAGMLLAFKQASWLALPPTTDIYAQLDYTWYLNPASGGQWQIYELGQFITSVGPAAVADQVSIHYDGNFVFYKLNGTTKRAVHDPGRTFYGGGAAFNPDAGVNTLLWGPTATLAVNDTEQLGANAASQSISGTAAALQTLSIPQSGAAVDLDVLSVTIQAWGGSVVGAEISSMLAITQLTGAGTPQGSVTIRRDGVDIGTAALDINSALVNSATVRNYNALLTLSVVDSPPIGYHIYTLHAHGSGGSGTNATTVAFTNSAMKLREYKR